MKTAIHFIVESADIYASLLANRSTEYWENLYDGYIDGYIQALRDLEKQKESDDENL